MVDNKPWLVVQSCIDKETIVMTHEELADLIGWIGIGAGGFALFLAAVNVVRWVLA